MTYFHPGILLVSDNKVSQTSYFSGCHLAQNHSSKHPPVDPGHPQWHRHTLMTLGFSAGQFAAHLSGAGAWRLRQRAESLIPD